MIYYAKCVSWQIFRDSVFVINESNKKMYTLKDVNKWFWLALVGEHKIENIASELYSMVKDVDFQTIYTDLLGLALNLKEEGLVVFVEKDEEDAHGKDA